MLSVCSVHVSDLAKIVRSSISGGLPLLSSSDRGSASSWTRSPLEAPRTSKKRRLMTDKGSVPAREISRGSEPIVRYALFNTSQPIILL